MKRSVIFLFGISLLCSAPAALAQATLTLPMRLGYYAQAPATCAAAIRDLSGMVVRARSLEWIDGANDVTQVTRGSTGDYTFTQHSEDEAGAVHTFTSKIRVINPSSFVLTTNYGDQETSPHSATYRFCSPNPPRDWN